MEQKTNIIQTLKRNVLIVDDEEINLEILSMIISDLFTPITALNGQEALEKIYASTEPISLVILDINMPVMNGFEFIKTIKNNPDFARIPIIVCTSDKEQEVKSLALGAVDFLKKPYDFPEIIKARIIRSIELSEDTLIIQSSERDELTKVYNKPIFSEYVLRIDKYQKKEEKDLYYLDIVRFHYYNELHGVKKGDYVLQSLAEILKEIARINEGIVGRLQGDVFLLYINHLDNYEVILDYIYSTLRNKYEIEDVKISVGIYNVTDKTENVESRINRAKLICHQTNLAPNINYSVFDHAALDKMLYKERLINDFNKAISERQFVVYYQPKYNITKDEPYLSSAEALIRWIHPELGFISPGEFIPLFEERGLITTLDQYVWKEVANQIKTWENKYHKIIPVSVNVSRVDTANVYLADVMLQIVNEAGIKPENLLLEITESAYIANNNKLIEIVNEFRSYGFKIEIDDFGSGYSSLNLLTTLPFDILKLDMSFIKNMENNDKALMMVKITKDISTLLETPIIAEGVETEHQYQILKELKFDVIQGYYFSKPLPLDEFEKLIK